MKMLAFLAASLAVGVAWSGTPTPTLVIDTRWLFPANSIPRTDNWLGLFCEKKQCILKPTAVHVKRILEENVLGEKEPGDKVSVSGKPIAVFRGAALGAGAKPTSDLEGQDTLFSKGSWSVSSGTSSVVLSRTPVKDSNRYRYYLSSVNIKQFLFEMDSLSHEGDPVGPYFAWVGDIDGDGEIDLLVSLSNDNCAFDERLYLSSKKKKGKIVQQVLRRSGYMPACGC